MASIEITPELVTELILDPTSAPASVSPQLGTVLHFLKAICDQDVQAIMRHFADEIEYHWVAKGFDELGARVKKRQQAEEFFSRSMGGNFVTEYKYTVLDYVEMPGKIALQMKSTGRLASGAGDYDNDYIWIFHLEQNTLQPKIKVAKEFFDSLYSARVWGLLPKETQVNTTPHT